MRQFDHAILVPQRRGRRRAALATVGAALLAGCTASSIAVDRRADLPPDAAGARFVMLHSPQQTSDPRYDGDVALVVAQLAARGFQQVSDPAQARFGVSVTEQSGVSAPPAAGERAGRGGGGGRRGGAGNLDSGSLSAGGASFRSGGGGHPANGGGAAARSEAPRVLEIDITDLRAPARVDQTGADRRVFTATARAETGSFELRDLSGALVTAALRDFPGHGHESFTAPVP